MARAVSAQPNSHNTTRLHQYITMGEVITPIHELIDELLKMLPDPPKNILGEWTEKMRLWGNVTENLMANNALGTPIGSDGLPVFPRPTIAY